MLTLCEVQIQRSLGNNIVKVEDVQHVLSVSLVQTNLIHADPAVFLDRQPMSGHGKPGRLTVRNVKGGSRMRLAASTH
jgi:hypothetical protein